MKPYLAVAAAIVSLLAQHACADLKWDETTIELHPNYGDQQAVGHFKYQNTGSTPVHIKDVKTSCGCTVAQVEKKEVGPGEKGEITATFTIGGHVGLQQKTITVMTDEAPTPVQTLILKAVIPQGLILTPNFVYWRTGEEAKPKTISVKAEKGFTPGKVEVKAENPEFTAAIQPAKEKGSWTITVKPNETDRNMASLITVKTDFPKTSPQTFSANASVTGAPVGQATNVTRP